MHNLKHKEEEVKCMKYASQHFRQTYEAFIFICHNRDTYNKYKFLCAYANTFVKYAKCILICRYHKWCLAQFSVDVPWSRALAEDSLWNFNLDISIERWRTGGHCHFVIAERASENKPERRRKSKLFYGSVVWGIKMKNECCCNNNNSNTDNTCSFDITQTDCNAGSYRR